MLKLDGAFAPVSTQRSIGYCRASVSPPTRFVSAQLLGGLKILYKHLGDTKNLVAPRKKHVQGSQTDPEGKFQPCYPIPLLAGRYKFVRVIGQGQSSILVAAEDTFHPDKKSVAVKIMHVDYSRLGAQEADCIQQLNKADILHVSRTVQLFNVFRFEGHYCLVFELLRPKPLHQYFQKCQFDSEEAKLKVIRKITLQLLQALGFLKRENVIHADLKPENILLEEGEEIKIKVVDFGNAIHWVHREVSLYYDEFELQTLLYRAPEVMFGVPFGPEIDVWSLGCILAELYIGKPLFLGRNKNEILQEVTSVFGPIPSNPFQTGKFFQELSAFVGHNPEVNQLVIATSLMKKLHNSRNYAFASFLVGLLQYNPSKRLTPCQAAMHPFLAPEFPCAFLWPWQGDKISAGAVYTDILLTPEQYVSRPHVDEEIERQHFSGNELLKKGTSVLYNGHKSLSPLLAKRTKENDLKNSSQATSANSANIQIDNSRYAMEGPLATNIPTSTHPRNKKSLAYKDRTCSSNFEKDEKEPSVSFRSATLTRNHSGRGNSNNNLLKLESKEPSDLVKGPQKSTSISSSSEVGRSLVKLKSRPSDTSKQNSYDILGECVDDSVKSHVMPEKLNEIPSQWKSDVLNTKGAEDDDRFTQTATSTTTGFHLDDRLSGNEMNSSARTRVYHRKRNSRKQQSDLPPEKRIRNLCHPTAGQSEEKASKFGHQEHHQLVNTPVVGKSLNSRRKEKEMYQEPLQQNSERAGATRGKYQDDEVMLL